MTENYGMMNIGPDGTIIVGGDFYTGYQPTVIHVTTSEHDLLKSVRQHVAADPVKREYDIFLSHATDDPYARTLCHALEVLGVNVWFDESSLGPGRILCGPSTVASHTPASVSSKNTNRYCRSAVGRKRVLGLLDDKEKVIPILHEVTWTELQKYS